MSKFFKIFINSFFVIIIIASLWSIIFVFVSWNDEIGKVVINSRILLGAEITFLDSEMELPLESSLKKDGKIKLFVIPWKNILNLRLFNSEISEHYLSQKITVRPKEYSRHEKLRLICRPPNFYIKNISLKSNDLLEIELNFDKFPEIFFMSVPIILIIMMVVLLRTVKKL